MFRKYPFLLALFCLWAVLSSNLKDPNNPPTGNTGAPLEGTCGRSGCHEGGTFTGAVTLSGIPDTIKANTTYSLVVTQTSNATRAGFQLTCLDKTNVKCGTLTAATGINVTTASGRQYARQSTPKNLSGGSTSWTFTWKSPTTLPADSIKFYFASLAANGNNQRTGDKVLTGTKKVVTTSSSVAAHEALAPAFAKVYPSVLQDQLTVDLLEASAATLTLVSTKGEVVGTYTLRNGAQTLSAAQWPAGVLLARITTPTGKAQQVKLVKE